MAKISTIKTLPEEVLGQLQEFLRDPKINQGEATERTNDLLDALDINHKPVSQSAVNRYAANMAKAGEKLEQTREISEMWIAKLGNAPQGKLGALLNEMIRAFVFELMLKLQDTKITADNIPDFSNTMNTMALALSRLEKSTTINQKREDEIKKAVLLEAANDVESAAVSRGMNKEEASFWREKVLMGR